MFASGVKAPPNISPDNNYTPHNDDNALEFDGFWTASVDDTTNDKEDNDISLSVVPICSFLPSSTLFPLISHFNSSCKMLQTGIDMFFDPKHDWPSFAFRRDSHKRIISEHLLLFRLRRALVLNYLRRVDIQLGTPHPFLGFRGSLSNDK